MRPKRILSVGFFRSLLARPASGETCGAHRSSGRQVYQMARFHAVAVLPREFRSLRPRHQHLHSGVKSRNRCAGQLRPLESSIDT
eukprot:7992127-Pyramimonas_sp.AAC.1